MDDRELDRVMHDYFEEMLRGQAAPGSPVGVAVRIGSGGGVFVDWTGAGVAEGRAVGV